MARQIFRFTATVPAATPQSAPVTVPLAVPVMDVDEIRLRIPPGPSGLMGFYLAVGGGRVIPYNGADWIVADDENMAFPLDSFPSSGAWSLVGYNLGTFAHSVMVTFLLSVPQAPVQLPPPPIPAAQLAGP